MKYVFSAIISVLTLAMAAPAAFAVDHPVPKRDLPPEATKPSISSIVSTANETTAPVELVKPEAAIDSAISSPVKAKSLDAVQDGSERPVAIGHKPEAKPELKIKNVKKVEKEAVQKPVHKAKKNKVVKKKSTKHHNRRKTDHLLK